MGTPGYREGRLASDTSHHPGWVVCTFPKIASNEVSRISIHAKARNLFIGYGADNGPVANNTEVDSNGETLTGANKYTLTFAKGQTPPVDGFWSLTMYELDKGWWFVPNELNKFTVSPRNDLQYTDDGSLTLYLQNKSPGKDKEAHWLPAPNGEFVLMPRMYWPTATPPSILDGTCKVPAAEKVK